MGRDKIWVGEWEVQTMGCKIGSRMYCTTWGIQPIFCNNCKWKVTFKKCIKIFLVKKKGSGYGIVQGLWTQVIHNGRKKSTSKMEHRKPEPTRKGSSHASAG